MKTTIKKIEVNFWKGKEVRIIYFDYFEKEQFTYIYPKALKYWREKTGIEDFYVGMLINVFKVPDSKHYKIVGVHSQSKEAENE